MTTYWILWTYIANFADSWTRVATAGVPSRATVAAKNAIVLAFSGFSDDFKKKATFHVVGTGIEDAPLVIKACDLQW